MASVAPLLAVDNVRTTLAFYEERLGFTREFSFPDDAPAFATVKLGGARLMFEAAPAFAAKYGVEAASGPRGHGVDINIAVDGDIDECYARASEGYPPVRPIFTTDYGMRQFTVRDPDGYLVTFIKHVGQG